jgi:hypothetical protein
MTNTDIATEALHRIERMQTGGQTLPRDSGSPPTITFEKMVGRIDVYTDL